MSAQRTSVKLRAPPEGRIDERRPRGGARQLQRSVGLRRGQSACRRRAFARKQQGNARGKVAEGRKGGGAGGRTVARMDPRWVATRAACRGRTGGSAAGRRWRMRRRDTAFMFGAVLEPRSSIRVVLSRAVGAAYNECPARVHPREDPELNHLLLPRARPFRFLMSAQRTFGRPAYSTKIAGIATRTPA